MGSLPNIHFWFLCIEYFKQYFCWLPFYLFLKMPCFIKHFGCLSVSEKSVPILINCSLSNFMFCSLQSSIFCLLSIYSLSLSWYLLGHPAFIICNFHLLPQAFSDELDSNLILVIGLMVRRKVGDDSGRVVCFITGQRFLIMFKKRNVLCR